MNTRAAAGKVKRRAKADRDYSSYETGQIHKQFERLIKKCSKNGEPGRTEIAIVIGRDMIKAIENAMNTNKRF